MRINCLRYSFYSFCFVPIKAVKMTNVKQIGDQSKYIWVTLKPWVIGGMGSSNNKSVDKSCGDMWHFWYLDAWLYAVPSYLIFITLFVIRFAIFCCCWGTDQILYQSIRPYHISTIDITVLNKRIVSRATYNSDNLLWPSIHYTFSESP